MAWDIFNIFIFVTNTFATPYQCSQDVFSCFKRDGGRYFICLFGIRLCYLDMWAPLTSRCSRSFHASIYGSIWQGESWQNRCHVILTFSCRNHNSLQYRKSEKHCHFCQNSQRLIDWPGRWPLSSMPVYFIV